MNIYFQNKAIWISAALALLSYNVFAQSPSNIENKILVKWEVLPNQNLQKNPISRLILKNTDKSALALKDWSLWFNFIRGIDASTIDRRFKLTHKNGDLFQIEFLKEDFKLQLNDTIQIEFKTIGKLVNYTDGPIGLYVNYDDKNSAANIVSYQTEKKIGNKIDQQKYLTQKYNLNELTVTDKRQDVIPLVKEAIINRKESYIIKNTVSIQSDFDTETKFISDFFTKQTAIVLNKNLDSRSQIKLTKTNGIKDEGYILSITQKGIEIKSSTAAGAFYGIQTLKSLIPANQWSEKNNEISLPITEIKDEPRFAYRGFMLDVARNFHSKNEVLRLLDMMAQYKLNKFHFHFIDDEGWRLEIPGLPELIEVGSVHSASFKDGKSLQPSYGSGATSKEKQYYSTKDYIEIIQYAAKRHIQVIPEIETPGHARAAIKSMLARYNKYQKEGNSVAAKEYLLHDLDDTSIYNSAQNWNDNVLNPALPSSYKFIGKIVDEIKSMHDQAGVPLTMIDLGGDETPVGVWEKSPKIIELMKQQDMKSALEVWPYYINKINDLCQSKGLIMSGWEEMGMKNLGKGMDVNPDLANHKIQLNVWNNLIGGGQEDLAYRLANAGYKTIYTSAYNNYLDMGWDSNFEEPGHSWVGLINLYKAYSFAPENYFINLRKDNQGNDLPANFASSKINLTAEGKANFLGVKGALWSEKINNDKRLEEMIFPRLIAIADRAWSPEQAWEQGATFNEPEFRKAYSAFMQKLGHDELKKLDKINNGYHYRVPSVGLNLINNKLNANTDYPGFKVYYTDNNTDPTLNSKQFQKGIPYNKNKTYKFRVITDKGDLGIISTY